MTTRHHTTIRIARADDHPAIVAVIQDWWNGRDLAVMIPRLFLTHFAGTSFTAWDDRGLAGFLIGFLSPDHPDEGYIHFAGVRPDQRGRGLGRDLFDRFAALCRERGRTVVRSCTSPVNRHSVAFHQRMGFEILPGDGETDGLPVTRDYNRPGDDKVLFRRRLDASQGERS